jgi:ribosomal protein S18 acetylase RimI-like enzyme
VRDAGSVLDLLRMSLKFRGLLDKKNSISPALISARQVMTDRAVAQIRIATLDDAPALGAMHVASWRETYAGLLPDKTLSSLSVEARATAWTKIMQEPATERSTVIYLAEHEGSIIAFGSCGAQRTDGLTDKGYDGEVSAIYVLREFQERKIGTRLFYAMSSDLIRRGFNAAALWVLRDNLRARRFYERYAGQVIAEREDVRGGAVLIELAYGWPDLKELERMVADE